MRINVSQQAGKEGLDNFLLITSPKETQQERNRRIYNEVLKEVFKMKW